MDMTANQKMIIEQQQRAIKRLEKALFEERVLLCEAKGLINNGRAYQAQAKIAKHLDKINFKGVGREPENNHAHS
jgi:5'-deoxynucleotidase YfbR-like HD superfamily hydrolase